MNRKITVILAVLLIFTAVSASAVFAKDSEGQEEKSAIKSMFDAMRSWAQQAQDNGEITKEEAKEWDSHFKAMEKYHRDNGFTGHCGGGTKSEDGENQSFMPRYRNGMMGNLSGNSL